MVLRGRSPLAARSQPRGRSLPPTPPADHASVAPASKPLPGAVPPRARAGSAYGLCTPPPGAGGHGAFRPHRGGAPRDQASAQPLCSPHLPRTRAGPEGARARPTAHDEHPQAVARGVASPGAAGGAGWTRDPPTSWPGPGPPRPKTKTNKYTPTKGFPLTQVLS